MILFSKHVPLNGGVFARLFSKAKLKYTLGVTPREERTRLSKMHLSLDE
jgi:hypothetical protein